MRWLVTGASGFLGERIVSLLLARGEEVVAHGCACAPRVDGARVIMADLSEPGAAARVVGESGAGALLHAAALTDVAACERDPERAGREIAGATQELAAAWSGRGPAVYFSTDLVFDGGSAPYAESAPAKPISVYGCQKLRAEEAFLSMDGGIVLRTALMFGLPGSRARGFVSWMLGELRAGRELTLFRDEFRTPAWTDDAARAAVELAGQGGPGRLFHLGGPARLSRAEMGVALARAIGVRESLVRPVALAESTYAAPRPRDVSLDSTLLGHTLRWTPVGFTDFLSRHSEQLRALSPP